MFLGLGFQTKYSLFLKLKGLQNCQLSKNCSSPHIFDVIPACEAEYPNILDPLTLTSLSFEVQGFKVSHLKVPIVGPLLDAV